MDDEEQPKKFGKRTPILLYEKFVQEKQQQQQKKIQKRKHPLKLMGNH